MLICLSKEHFLYNYFVVHIADSVKVIAYSFACVLFTILFDSRYKFLLLFMYELIIFKLIYSVMFLGIKMSR